MRKNFISLLAFVLLLVGVLAGCTNTNNQKDNGETNVGNKTDYRDGFPERVTLEIPVYDRALEGWNVSDNYWTRWIQQEFGEKYNIDVKFVPIGRASEVTDYQQLLASGRAPDIIYHYDMPAAMNYYHAEVMQPLDHEEISRYAPTYWKNMQETIETYGTINDENIFFFAERPDIGNFVSYIRKDWVESVGMKVEDLTSLEKYNEMLMKWKEAGIGTGADALIQNQYGYSGAFRDWPVDPEYDALYNDIAVADFTTEASEKALRNLSYQYHNGLIDKEFYLRDTGEKVKAEFVAGRTGTFGEYITSNSDTFAAVKKNNPEAEIAVLPPGWNMPEGSVPHSAAPFPFGMIMGINYTSSAEERIAVWLYLEWMSQPENLFTLQNGIDGENYNGLDENGVPIATENFEGDSALSPNNNKDYWCLVVEAPKFGSEEQTIKALKSFWSPPGYEYIVDDMLKYREQTLEYQVPAPLFTVPIDSVSKYRADLGNLFQKLYLDIVLSPADQFDTKYEAGKKQFLEAGYQEILDEKQKAIDAGNVIWSEKE